MTLLQQALSLAGRGFHVFPCEANGKLPAIKDFPNRATRDPAQIEKWFKKAHRNIGISTTSFGEGQSLVVIDVDNKNGKAGDAQIFSLELEGFELPQSFEQTTPNGGRHIIYVADQPYKQGVNVLGDGLDIRSRGGFIVGTGSSIDGKTYEQIGDRTALAPAPDWLLRRLGADPVRRDIDNTPLGGVDSARAEARALAYLKTAPVSVENEGGDITAFKVACKLKDFGCSCEQAFDLLHEHWNDRCDPPWDEEDLNDKVRNAYGYGREPQGATAPEAVFSKVAAPAGQDEDEESEHPADKLNKEYAFIKQGAFVLQETTDDKGVFTTMHLTPPDMHAWFANKTLGIQGPKGGVQQVPLSKLWMSRASRREFDSVVFAPGKDVPSRFYNLWRGFTVEPAAHSNHPSVEAFKEHALKNVCGGNEALCQWLLGFFAHMIQKPWEKPLVALVFKGSKGTGKNALVERVGSLLGPHFMVADDERYLLGNFNSHLESNLFFVLDEASWAGDKRAEGKLKGLTTGSRHNIERKGAEPYKVDNLTRVAIIGNEDWLVPASFDERRYAVFSVGDGRRQDRDFFHNMRVGMEDGGYAYLLKFLLDFDLSAIDVNEAPQTQGLIDQKHASLAPVQEWWFDCVSSNSLAGGDWDGDMPPTIPTNRMRQAFEHWARGRNIRSRLPGRNDFLKTLQAMAPSLVKVKARPDEPTDSTYAYRNDGISHLRDNWDTYIGGSHEWPTH